MGEKKYVITREEAVSGVLYGRTGTFRIFIDGQICGAKNVALLQNTMNAGNIGARHDHETEHCQYILSGTGTFHIEGKSYPVGPGTAIFVPPNIPHQIDADEGEELNYIVIYAPAGPEQKLREKGANAFDK